MIYVAFDVETTGLEPGSRLVELAAIQFVPDDEHPGPTFQELVNPGMPMPADTAAQNGITTEMLAEAHTADAVLKDFFDWLPPDPVLIAHWARFDTGIITWESGRCGVQIPAPPVICTCGIARSIGCTKDNKLDTLVEHYQITRIGDAHRALSDADACRQYFQIIAKEHAILPAPWDKAGHNYHYPPELPPALHGLPDLVALGADFAFTYQDAKGDMTERTITPYGWANVEPGGLMFHGMCKLRGARRTFRADRIQVAGPA